MSKKDSLNKSSHVSASSRPGGAKESFGEYLKYWRQVKPISQEQLAHDLNCSTKHISFLENGHTRPSQSLILRISEAMHLSKSDTNHLLISAGFRPAYDLIEDTAAEKAFLKKSLIMVMQNIGGCPALIRDRLGNIKMINRACVVFWEKWLGDSLYDMDLMNTYRLAFSDRGWRPYIDDWPELAQIFLITLKQELLLEYDPEAEKLLQMLASSDGIPKNWDREDNVHTKRPSFLLKLKFPDNIGRTSSLVCTSTIGSLNQSVRSSLTLEIFTPFGYEPPYTAQEIAAMTDVRHPLLPY